MRKRFLALLLIGIGLGVSLTAQTQQNVEVVMPTRFNFVPKMFDAIRTSLERDLGHRVHFRVVTLSPRQPPPNLGSASWLLLEEGSEEDFISSAAVRLPVFVDFCWVLACRNRRLPGLAPTPPNTLADWEKQLIALRERDEDHYPWFESLFSMNTLCRILQAEPAPLGHRTGTRDVPPGRSEPSPAFAFLQRAIDRKWLNPLAVEADPLLALEVFLAGDAIFSSLWLPASALEASGTIPFLGPDVSWAPFPRETAGAPVPCARFQLWALGTPALSLTLPEAGVSCPFPNLPNLQRCSFPDDMVWMHSVGPSVYDRLIMGDL